VGYLYPYYVAGPELSSTQAAQRLGVTRPTVRKLLADGLITGQPEGRGGGRFRWRISADSVESYLAKRNEGNRARRQGKRISVAQLRDELQELRGEVRALAAASTGSHDAAVLRAEVTTLREALLQQRIIADALKAADQARAEVIAHLLAAVAAGETADAHRRTALDSADNIAGQFLMPGNIESLRD
jgi:excisionase family DNA binding protein